MMLRHRTELHFAITPAAAIKRLADAVLSKGPENWSENDVDVSRYAITNLIDDLRAPRSYIELVATGTELHRALAQHIFRTRRIWMACGKTIPRQLERILPQLASKWNVGFTSLFESGNIDGVVSLADLGIVK